MREVKCPSCGTWIKYWIDKCRGWSAQWFEDKALEEHMAEKHD